MGNSNKIGAKIILRRYRELYVTCPNCKATETLYLLGDELYPACIRDGKLTQGKWHQIKGRIYHTCSSCRRDVMVNDN